MNVNTDDGRRMKYLIWIGLAVFIFLCGIYLMSTAEAEDVTELIHLRKLPDGAIIASGWGIDGSQYLICNESCEVILSFELFENCTTHCYNNLSGVDYARIEGFFLALNNSLVCDSGECDCVNVSELGGGLDDAVDVIGREFSESLLNHQDNLENWMKNKVVDKVDSMDEIRVLNDNLTLENTRLGFKLENAVASKNIYINENQRLHDMIWSFPAGLLWLCSYFIIFMILNNPSIRERLYRTLGSRTKFDSKG